LRQTAASGASEVVECSWKLDSSAGRTSGPSPSAVTSSTGGVPTFPTAVASSPAWRRIAAVMVTVVVLPFVPVIASHGA
jgi:hypothetical protein